MRQFAQTQNTHNFVWSCLSHWASRQTSGAYLAELLNPNQKKMYEWVAPVGGSASLAALASQWFLQWGMDLLTLGDDQKARNNASYQPGHIGGSYSSNPSKALSFVRDLWSTLQPKGASTFEVIDRTILRLSIESIFTGKTGLHPQADKSQFENFIDPVISQFGFNPPVEALWRSYLLRDTNGVDPSIFHYSQFRPDAWRDSELAVISRACLLLRIASGATARLFERANVTKSLLSFWRERVGLRHGIWETGGEPEDLPDLWDEIGLMIEDADPALLPGGFTTYGLSKDLAYAINRLGSCERVLLWTVAPA